MTEQEKTEAMAMDPRNMRIGEALHAARVSVSATVQKQGEKTEGGGGKYKYVGHEHVVLHVRRALHEHGLTFTQTSCVLIGGVGVWRAMFELEHVSGASKVYGPYECTLPSNGKEAFIASTALDRTALLRLFGLAGSAEEDPEHNSNNRDEPTTRTSQERVQNMGARRDMKAEAAAERAGIIRSMIADLPAMKTREGLIEWAAWLLEGDNTCTIPDAEKKVAWNAYGKRCQAIGIDPNQTVREYTAESKALKARLEREKRG